MTCPTILLVDDSPGERELFGVALRETQFSGTLLTADGGRTALAQLVALPDGTTPAVLLLDLKLRGETGLDLLRTLRNDARWAPLPVVILTTSDDPGDIQASYRAGANGYVVKPSRLEDLTTVVRALCTYWVGCNCHASTRHAC